MHVASGGLDAAADVAPQLTPFLRTRYDDRNYLYNTDGIIFSENGYPVSSSTVPQLLHEAPARRVPRHERHVAQGEFPYAVAITKVMVETVARETEVPPG